MTHDLSPQDIQAIHRAFERVSGDQPSDDDVRAVRDLFHLAELDMTVQFDLPDVLSTLDPDGKIVPGEVGGRPIPVVQVVTDHPVQSCLASQYAGWAISEGKYFAMGSGPMRAVRGRGLMIGLDFTDHDTAETVQRRCYERGLLVLTAGEHSIRLAPPLIVTPDQADSAMAIIDDVIASL